MIRDLADAIVTALNAEDFTKDFTAVRTLLPEYELKDMKTLHVTVIPREMEIKKINRAQNRKEMTIDIAVQVRPGDVTNAVLEPYLDLADEIVEFLDRKDFTSPAAIWLQTEHNPLCAYEHLRELRQITSVIHTRYLAIE